jgi:hypothetical protein
MNASTDKEWLLQIVDEYDLGDEMFELDTTGMEADEANATSLFNDLITSLSMSDQDEVI